MRCSVPSAFVLSQGHDAHCHQVFVVEARCCVLVRYSRAVKVGHAEHVLFSLVFFSLHQPSPFHRVSESEES